jgi:predicted membrane-bound spermidine synthase
MTRVLYLLFFLSGAAGLMYESVWSRYLGLFVGHQAYAQVLVLVIFLGGMSLGAALVSRRAEQLRDPLRDYAIIELVVGVIGLGFHLVFVSVTDWAYGIALPSLAGGPFVNVFKWGLAGLLILPQSILLGTTFPLMSAGVLRRIPETPGAVLGWLYFTNSIGAAVGVLIAGFVLVDRFGLPGVLTTAALLNIAVAIAAYALGRRHPAPAETSSVRRQEPVSQATDADRRPGRALLAVAFLTAAASFAYEIGWIRMLSLVLGSATRSFELMLSAFILGLALGAFAIRNRTERLREPLLALAVIQVVMGLTAVATLPVYLASFHGMEVLLGALSRNGPGYWMFTIARYGFCLAVMLPSTICAGMTLPLITRTLLARGGGERSIGQVYAINTLGSIVGVALAGMLLLPLLGLKGLVIAGASLDVLIGLALLPLTTRRQWLPGAVILSGILIVAVAIGASFDERVLTSGVFRRLRVEDSRRYTTEYYADGRTATISVSADSSGMRVLSTNGKADASIRGSTRAACVPGTPLRSFQGDEITQFLTGLLPLAYAPEARTAAMIGLGSGISSHVMLASPTLDELVTLEIEPRMIDGARFFDPANRRAYQDPRSRLVVDDAKAYFATADRTFDMIVSEPSNPWVKGVSSLFTVEFYRRVRAQLAEGGIFAQWLQAYELDDDLVLHVLAALNEVFPHWRVHQVGSGDLLFIAAKSGQLPAPDFDRVAGYPLLAEDLCGYVPVTGAHLASTYLGSERVIAPALGHIREVNSDYFPLLDLRAERRRFEERTADGLLLLGDEWSNLAGALEGVRREPVEVLGLPFIGMRRLDQQFLQSWQQHVPPQDSMAAPAIASAQFEWARHQAVLARDLAPPDWRPWNLSVLMVSRARHAGTAGWVDTTFHAEVAAFAERHDAPAMLQAALAFRRAMLAWDWGAVEREGADLVAGNAVKAGWIGGDELRDGLVVGAWMNGHRDAAKGWWSTLAPISRRGRDDVRSHLLSGMFAASGRDARGN